VAIVRLRDGYGVSRTALIAEAEHHIARYKLPKQIVFVNEVVRSPSGKADYRWAARLAASDY
jgi:fatty-acyl-CoA synthase